MSQLHRLLLLCQQHRINLLYAWRNLQTYPYQTAASSYCQPWHQQQPDTGK